MRRPPRRSSPFPYTTLFRSFAVAVLVVLGALLALGWVLSSRVIVPAPYSLMPEFEIVAVERLEAEADAAAEPLPAGRATGEADRKSTRLNSSHVRISYAVFC